MILDGRSCEGRWHQGHDEERAWCVGRPSPVLSESDLRATSLEHVNLTGAYLEGADLRGIPWVIIKELTLQPGVLFENIRYDLLAEETRQEEEGSSPSEPL